MKKLFIVLLAVAALCALPLFASAEDTVLITDHADNVVEVPTEINRIVIADIYPLTSVLSVFFDSAEKLVGVAGPSMVAAKNSLLAELYPELLNAETGFIDGTNINVEEVLKLEPDVVFYSSGSEQIGTALREIGIPAIAISADRWNYDAIETLNHWIELLSQMFPENDRTQMVADYSQKIFDLVQERTKDIPEEEKERIFFLFQYNDSTITTSGKLFFGQYWADSIHALNVGEELETNKSTPVNMEQVYVWNPDRILITNFNSAQPEDLFNNSIGSYDWSEINAVKNGKVNKMPLGLYRSYTAGVDTPITLLWLAKTVYPERFEDIDMTSEVQNYYKFVFGIDLSAEQAEKIFTPTGNASAF